MNRFLDLLQSYFGSWRFPIFLTAVILGYEAVLVGLLLLPYGGAGEASFADEFRIWCFGYDPATGQTLFMAVFATFTSPLIMLAVLGVVWLKPIQEILRSRPIAVLPHVVAALTLVCTSSWLLAS